MNLFWGIILILLGIILVVKVVFRVDIPVFKILLAFFFLYLGIRILVGSSLNVHFKDGHHDAVFSESNFSGTTIDRRDYNAVFGKVKLDLRNLVLTEKETRVEVNAVFGGAEIILNKETPVRIKASAVFGGARLPDGNAGGFGTTYYESDSLKKADKYLFIDINAVFGGVEVFTY
ncbi:MAG: LiaF-related protein [Bacteroidia bacterium]|nr:LiaF-related protein [Bacteroidia bacterium]